MSISKITTLLLTILIFGFIISPSVYAENSPSKTRKEIAQVKLQDAKLKSCQAKEASIKKRSTNLAKMANNMLTKFESIAEKVKVYYTQKAVPSGKTISNYDSLVADIQTKKVAVQTALTTAENNAGSFSCTANDPKGQLTTFRTDMQAVKSALKEYRTSVKNLIVAVRSVTGEENKSATPSAKP